MYETQLKLYELEGRLPQYFVRISKSCIANIMKIDSISRNITGASEISFVKTNKIVYCSRSYLKMLTDKIKEMRL
jgi:DNA-binding LytR/AlgR family response regulator